MVALSPIYLILHSKDTVPTHSYTLGIVYLQSTVTQNASQLPMFNHSDFVIFTILAILLALILIFSAIVAYQTAHYIIRPLRMLNNKMINIIIATEGDIELTADVESSHELTLLYNEFKDLISAKKFENNNFMLKSDALAVIDLAEACDMFDGKNYKAAGICYNNIANIQYKNEKYAQAAENYFHSMEQAAICLGHKSP